MSKTAIGLGLFGIGATTAVATPLAMTLGGGSGEGTGQVNEQITQEETPAKLPEAPSTPVATERSLTPKLETREQVKTVKAPTPEVPSKPFTPPSWPKKSIPQLTSSSEVQSKYKEIACLKNYFSNLNKSDSSTKDLTSFHEFKFDAGTRSCLAVEYYQQEYTDNKWWGEFRLVWSLKDETNKQGLITSINLRINNGQILGSASIYMLTSGDNKNWTISHKKEKTEIALTNNNDVQSLIPQADEIKKVGAPDAINWGFNPKVKEVCSGKACGNTNKNADHFSGVWNLEKSGNSTTNLRDWCINVGNRFENIFTLHNFENSINGITGTWKKQS